MTQNNINLEMENHYKTQDYYYKTKDFWYEHSEQLLKTSDFWYESNLAWF